ncbi:MAG: cupin domain-containing protein [Verrucomicrobia bacterium]|nr:MAG: cupin domain-containing protein [Verrucomicrobiota bacterium]
MEIKRSGSQPSNKGPADWFTGTVQIDPLFQAPDPARVACASVTFEPGARTAWHTHPLGQTLILTSGLGWPTTAMTHIAIQEALNGKPVDWMEKVSEEQYKRS